jgi:hypothetical protein
VTINGKLYGASGSGVWWGGYLTDLQWPWYNNHPESLDGNGATITFPIQLEDNGSRELVAQLVDVPDGDYLGEAVEYEGAQAGPLSDDGVVVADNPFYAQVVQDLPDSDRDVEPSEYEGLQAGPLSDDVAVLDQPPLWIDSPEFDEVDGNDYTFQQAPVDSAELFSAVQDTLAPDGDAVEEQALGFESAPVDSGDALPSSILTDNAPDGVLDDHDFGFASPPSQDVAATEDHLPSSMHDALPADVSSPEDAEYWFASSGLAADALVGEGPLPASLYDLLPEDGGFYGELDFSSAFGPAADNYSLWIDRPLVDPSTLWIDRPGSDPAGSWTNRPGADPTSTWINRPGADPTSTWIDRPAADPTTPWTDRP